MIKIDFKQFIRNTMWFGWVYYNQNLGWARPVAAQKWRWQIKPLVAIRR